MLNFHFLQTPGLWFFVSFLLFALLIGRPIWTLLLFKLNTQMKEIETQLEEANQVHTDAKNLLHFVQKQKEATEQQVQSILDQAKKKVSHLSKEAQDNWAILLKREEKKAQATIQRLEYESTQRLQDAMTQISLQAAHQILAHLMSDQKAQELFNQKAMQTLQEKDLF